MLAFWDDIDAFKTQLKLTEGQPECVVCALPTLLLCAGAEAQTRGTCLPHSQVHLLRRPALRDGPASLRPHPGGHYQGVCFPGR